MTTLQLSDTRPATAGQVTTLRRVVASELTKLRMRSTVTSLAVAAFLLVAIAAALAIGVVVQGAEGLDAAPGANPATAAFNGVSTAAWAVAVLGVIAVTGEFASHSVATTFSAVPNRGLVVAAKALVLGAVTLAVMLPAMVITFVTAQLILARAGVTMSLLDAGVLQAVVGAAVYLTVVALLGAAVGWLIRSTVGAYMFLLGVLMILPALVGLLPGDVPGTVMPYLPDAAGVAVMQLEPVPGLLSPWAGFLVLAAYVVGALLLATVVVRRRDIR
ncbi:ABC transporter permease family protein [Georgenia subflava]|uniref:ABC transporter permease n=1 Tax=Georgenia subflava TaxID=1622177 RepID=A0A6N7EG35_9MICO|nr:ABC transporter permease [Georgenia subflava]MPV35637.1 ABC transporter permease [Georgenia subflava]